MNFTTNVVPEHCAVDYRNSLSQTKKDSSQRIRNTGKNSSDYKKGKIDRVAETTISTTQVTIHTGTQTSKQMNLRKQLKSASNASDLLNLWPVGSTITTVVLSTFFSRLGNFAKLGKWQNRPEPKREEYLEEMITLAQKHKDSLTTEMISTILNACSHLGISRTHFFKQLTQAFFKQPKTITAQDTALLLHAYTKLDINESSTEFFDQCYELLLRKDKDRKYAFLKECKPRDISLILNAHVKLNIKHYRRSELFSECTRILLKKNAHGNPSLLRECTLQNISMILHAHITLEEKHKFRLPLFEQAAEHLLSQGKNQEYRYIKPAKLQDLLLLMNHFTTVGFFPKVVSEISSEVMKRDIHSLTTSEMSNALHALAIGSHLQHPLFCTLLTRIIAKLKTEVHTGKNRQTIYQQLHQIVLALKFDSTGIEQPKALISELGILVGRSETGQRPPFSPFQNEVFTALRYLFPSLRKEKNCTQEIDGLVVDILCGKVIIEVNDHSHYEGQQLDGQSIWKLDVLREMGYDPFVISHHDWCSLTNFDDKVSFLRSNQDLISEIQKNSVIER